MNVGSVEANLTDLDNFSESHAYLSSSVDPSASACYLFCDEEVLDWTTQEISQLDPEQIELLPLHQIRLLSPEQLRSLTLDQISVLTMNQISALGSKGSRASLKDLTHTQLKALNEFALLGLDSLEPLEQLEALSAEQFEVAHVAGKALPSLIQEYFGHRVEEELSQKKGSTEEILKISVEELQRREFKQTEIRELFLGNYIQHFSPQQIAAIQPQFMKFFWSIPFLSVNQTKALTSRQIVYLSAQQLNLFSILQIQALEINQILTINFRSDIEELSRSFVQALFPNLTANVIQRLSPKQIARETNPKAKSKLRRLRSKAIIMHCEELNREQLQAIHPEAMQFFGKADLKELRVDQIRDLLPEQMSWIKPEQFLGFSQPQIAQFSEKQIQALTPPQIRIISDFQGPAQGITPYQLVQFLPEQISRFGADDRLKEFLKGNRIAVMEKTQLRALTLEQIRVLAFDWEIRQALILRRNELSWAQKQALQ